MASHAIEQVLSIYLGIVWEVYYIGLDPTGCRVICRVYKVLDRILDRVTRLSCYPSDQSQPTIEQKLATARC